jgi:hypothetical protein
MPPTEQRRLTEAASRSRFRRLRLDFARASGGDEVGNNDAGARRESREDRIPLMRDARCHRHERGELAGPPKELGKVSATALQTRSTSARW